MYKFLEKIMMSNRFSNLYESDDSETENEEIVIYPEEDFSNPYGQFEEYEKIIDDNTTVTEFEQITPSTWKGKWKSGYTFELNYDYEEIHFMLNIDFGEEHEEKICIKQDNIEDYNGRFTDNQIFNLFNWKRE